FFAGCQKLAPLLATAQNSGLAGANGGVLGQVRERHHAIPDLSRSFLDGERLHRIHAHAVENDVSVLRDLEQEIRRSWICPPSSRIRSTRYTFPELSNTISPSGNSGK